MAVDQPPQACGKHEASGRCSRRGPQRSLLPRCRVCEFVREWHHKGGQEASSGRREYVAGGVGERPGAARHGTTMKWSFAVSCRALDDETGVEGGGVDKNETHSRRDWCECKNARAGRRGTARAPRARPRGLASVSIHVRLGPRRWWVIFITARRHRSRLARLGRELVEVLGRDDVVASLTRCGRLVVRERRPGERRRGIERKARRPNMKAGRGQNQCKM